MSTVSYHKKRQQLEHLKASVTHATGLWKDDAVLGAASSHVHAVSVPYNVHTSVGAMGLLNLCLFAANGVRSKMRQNGILTSFGSMYYAGKKTGKSNYTDLVHDNADVFQLWLNEAIFKQMDEAKRASAAASAVVGRDEPPVEATWPDAPTICVFKNVGPEEMLARCSPTRKGRLHWAAIRAEAEMATFLEQVNLIGTGGNPKKYEHQGSLNELFDTGAPSKLYRDESKNYGSDLYSKWQAVNDARRVPQMAFYHTGCLNIAQAFSLITEEEGLHAMALLERYIMAPLLPVNPYADPPHQFIQWAVAQQMVVVDENGTLKRDAHGLWRRDLLDTPCETILEGAVGLLGAGSNNNMWEVKFGMFEHTCTCARTSQRGNHLSGE